jgi:pseudaminic acid synthase
MFIGRNEINKNSPVYFIAELSANHQQDIEIALKTIEKMKESGANAVKLQTFKPESITLDCNNSFFQIRHGTLWDGMTLYKLYKKVYTPWEWQPKLKEYAESIGLDFFSSPFDFEAVDFLCKMNVPAFKIASFEITDIPLIEYIVSKQKPIIISTGIATLEDINLALKVCRSESNKDIALLKCTSAYPTPLEEVNLLTIPDMEKRFKVIVGLSDHTLGISVPVAASVLGAKIIEKHFILDRKLGGPDSAFSLEPREFKNMVDIIRETEKSMGRETYELTGKQISGRKFARSLFAVKDIEKGEVLTKENIRSIRPGDGLHPKYFYDIIGKKANTDISFGTPLSWDLIE